MASYLAAAGAGVAVNTGALVPTSSGPGCGGAAGGGSPQAESAAAASRREARELRARSGCAWRAEPRPEAPRASPLLVAPDRFFHHLEVARILAGEDVLARPRVRPEELVQRAAAVAELELDLAEAKMEKGITHRARAAQRVVERVTSGRKNLA